MDIDPNDLTYSSYHSKTKLGLEVASLAAAGYGAYKGFSLANKVSRASLYGLKLPKKALKTPNLNGVVKKCSCMTFLKLLTL